ncbi:hypothetical protein EJ04DRAFT_508035 [Polyplosphaeria fusca]|uniref:Uncharacterized protein n=1 Tax=Polyplosphaeria fusca TaxID=682080 RepID=A0A9P4V8E9_9PLEO|nr:hypothetical protein EJ04DRAFT_508035 [Polyplosphaeria fusca]
MTTQVHPRPSALPTSPQPSPPRKRPKKHNQDPFFDLSNIPLTSPIPPSSPNHAQQDSQDTPDPPDSLITRAILTPLYMTSFLISLFLINRSSRARRTASHPSQTSFLSYFSPRVYLDPEPYQDPLSSTWERRGSTSHVEPHPFVGDEKKRGWHLHKKIRKVARLEIGDAFEMRRHVVVMMVGAAVLLGAALMLGFRVLVWRLWAWGAVR